MRTATTTSLPTLPVYHGQGEETIRLVTIAFALIERPDFQRDRLKRQIERYTRDWDATAYAFPMVAYFQGHYIDLDGQQRLGASEELGREKVVVMLLEGVASKERLADLFLRLNRDKKLLDAFQKFIGALAAKDRGALTQQKLLEQFCLEMGKSATSAGHVPAGAIAWIFDRGGSELLERVLMVREMAWGDNPCREAFESKTLTGLATFISRYFDKINDDWLVAKLRKLHPGYILTKTSHRDVTVTYADFLREYYNKGLRKGRL